jgi:hypothetical protein
MSATGVARANEKKQIPGFWAASGCKNPQRSNTLPCVVAGVN